MDQIIYKGISAESELYLDKPKMNFRPNKHEYYRHYKN